MTKDAGQPACNGTTAAGQPCRLRPFAGGGGRCHLHANLPPTEAHVQGARGNARKHGFFARTLPPARRALLRRAEERLREPLAVRRELAAFHMVRAAEMARWEAETGKPSPLTTAAFATLHRYLSEIPDEGGPEAIDHVQLAQQVERLVAEDPSILLGRLPPDVRTKVEAVLREAGLLPAAG